MRIHFVSKREEERGQSIVEYTLILALIAIVAIVGLAGTSRAISCPLKTTLMTFMIAANPGDYDYSVVVAKDFMTVCGWCPTDQHIVIINSDTLAPECYG